jgi:hypothetical protein
LELHVEDAVICSVHVPPVIHFALLLRVDSAKDENTTPLCSLVYVYGSKAVGNSLVA